MMCKCTKTKENWKIAGFNCGYTRKRKQKKVKAGTTGYKKFKGWGTADDYN